MSKPTINFDIVFDTLSAPCAVLDQNLCFVEVNQLYLKTLLRTREELIGVNVLVAFPESPERQSLIENSFRRAFQGEANSLNEIVYRIPALEEKDGMREIWWTVHSSPLPDDDGKLIFITLRVEDVTEKVRNRHLKDAISGEIQHRVGNLLSLVSTIARRTADHSDNMSEFIGDFDSRIHALARTHSLLTGGNWDGTMMESLVMKHLESYINQQNDYIVVDGPELKLSAVEAQTMSMALHELATNSAKYGALKTVDGRLSISWKKLDDNGYELEWREDGLKDIQEPKKQGFGSMILTKILPSQLNGRVIREFSPTSHIYRLMVESRSD